jgi:hypothetical protein
MSEQPYVFVDHARLVSDLKAGDPRALAWAYREKFSDQLGRLILTHQLAEAGVGAVRGPGLSALDARYHDGRADHALHLLNLAGYGAMSIAHAVAADILEGRDHDGHDHDDGTGAGSGFGGPDPVPTFD